MGGGVRGGSGGRGLQFPGVDEFKKELFESHWLVFFPQLGRRCRGCLAGFVPWYGLGTVLGPSWYGLGTYSLSGKLEEHLFFMT